MRVFDSIEDVKTHLTEKIAEYDAKAEDAFMKRQQLSQRTLAWQALAATEQGCRSAAFAYRDALDALGEIRPGVWDALQAKKTSGNTSIGG